MVLLAITLCLSIAPSAQSIGWENDGAHLLATVTGAWGATAVAWEPGGQGMRDSLRQLGTKGSTKVIEADPKLAP